MAATAKIQKDILSLNCPIILEKYREWSFDIGLLFRKQGFAYFFQLNCCSHASLLRALSMLMIKTIVTKRILNLVFVLEVSERKIVLTSNK